MPFFFLIIFAVEFERFAFIEAYSQGWGPESPSLPSLSPYPNYSYLLTSIAFFSAALFCSEMFLLDSWTTFTSSRWQLW